MILTKYYLMMSQQAADSFVLKNKNGIEITFTAHGGRITSIKWPSPDGDIVDVVVGFDTIEESLKGDLYFGALCGRYANRVHKGRFTIDGESCQLDTNNGENHLHGGFEGFNNRIWDVKPFNSGNLNAFRLSLTSPHGDQKYPGTLNVSVIYSLSESNELRIEYEANTSKATIINLTSHSYFNLKGAGKGNVLDQLLTVYADQYTPINAETGTADGAIDHVNNTPFDFTWPKHIAEAVNSKSDQIRMVDGLDHNFVLRKNGTGVSHAATLLDPASGRQLDVYTDQPGLQVYTGNHFDGSMTGKKGAKISQYAGVALETQIFPNSPNVAHFPNAILRPGETYRHTCVYKFSGGR